MHCPQIIGRRFFRGINFCKQAVNFADKTINAHQAFIRPHGHLVKRPDKHFIQTERIGAIGGDNIVRIDHIAARLRHLLAVFSQNHSVRRPALIRFLGRHQSQIIQKLMPETGIQQVQRGMLHSSVVPINIHPVIKRFLGGKFFAVVRIAITQEIPGRTGPVRHGIRFTAGLGAAFRALCI